MITDADFFGFIMRLKANPEIDNPPPDSQYYFIQLLLQFIYCNWLGFEFGRSTPRRAGVAAASEISRFAMFPRDDFLGSIGEYKSLKSKYYKITNRDAIVDHFARISVVNSEPSRVFSSSSAQQMDYQEYLKLMRRDIQNRELNLINKLRYNPIVDFTTISCPLPINLSDLLNVVYSERDRLHAEVSKLFFLIFSFLSEQVQQKVLPQAMPKRRRQSFGSVSEDGAYLPQNDPGPASAAAASPGPRRARRSSIFEKFIGKPAIAEESPESGVPQSCAAMLAGAQKATTRPRSLSESHTKLVTPRRRRASLTDLRFSVSDEPEVRNELDLLNFYIPLLDSFTTSMRADAVATWDSRLQPLIREASRTHQNLINRTTELRTRLAEIGMRKLKEAALQSSSKGTAAITFSSAEAKYAFAQAAMLIAAPKADIESTIRDLSRDMHGIKVNGKPFCSDDKATSRVMDEGLVRELWQKAAPNLSEQMLSFLCLNTHQDSLFGPANFILTNFQRATNITWYISDRDCSFDTITNYPQVSLYVNHICNKLENKEFRLYLKRPLELVVTSAVDFDDITKVVRVISIGFEVDAAAISAVNIEKIEPVAILDAADIFAAPRFTPIPSNPSMLISEFKAKIEEFCAFPTVDSVAFPAPKLS